MPQIHFIGSESAVRADSSTFVFIQVDGIHGLYATAPAVPHESNSKRKPASWHRSQSSRISRRAIMRKLGKLAVLVLCAAVTLPISAESPYSHALMQSSCAPWDGPAIDVTLTREPAQCNRTDGPFLELGV